MQGPLLRVAPGAALLGLLRGHRIEGFERSFRMSAGEVLADRFLAGIHKAHLARRELGSLCAGMGLPRASIDAVLANADPANAFHFGYEGAGSGAIYKVYLEFAARLAGLGNEARSVLLYLAWKWKAEDPASCTVARYECFQGLQAGDQVGRVKRIAPGAACGVEALVDRFTERSGAAPMYLEVTEEGNPRRSFDINFHDAGLPLTSIRNWLEDMRGSMGIPQAPFDAAFGAAGDAVLGHLSGGTSREGREFLTVYYPAQPPCPA